MLKLNNAAPSEPFWLQILPGQRTQFKPATMAMILVAREQAGKAMLAALLGGDAKQADAAKQALAPIEVNLVDARARVGFVVAMAQLAIVAWEGVGDDDGQPIAPSQEIVMAYMANWRVYDAVNRLYVEPALSGAEEKKRIRALAEWHFGGRNSGQDYCQHCEAVCADCPYTVNAPQTPDGIAAWGVFERCNGQLRHAVGSIAGKPLMIVHGLDFGAVLSYAHAMGAVSPLLVELLPEVEALIVRAHHREGE